MINRLSIASLDAICDIAKESFDIVWTSKDFAYFLSHECGFGLGVEDDGKLQAYLVGLLVQGELDIASIATRKSARRHGLGLSLLETAKNASTIKSIVLEVDSSNDEAIALYKKAGFEKRGLRKKYYQGKGDAILMAWPR